VSSQISIPIWRQGGPRLCCRCESRIVWKCIDSPMKSAKRPCHFHQSPHSEFPPAARSVHPKLVVWKATQIGNQGPQLEMISCIEAFWFLANDASLGSCWPGCQVTSCQSKNMSLLHFQQNNLWLSGICCWDAEHLSTKRIPPLSLCVVRTLFS
jgi:hypothetical protein